MNNTIDISNDDFLKPISISHNFPSDRPWKRTTVDELTDEEIEGWIAGIRERRLILVHKYQQAVKEANETRVQDLREFIQQQLRMLDRNMSTMERACEQIEKRLLNCQAAKLEMKDLIDELE